MKDIIVIIPAYKPNEKIMLEFMEKLQKECSNIVIVDDGSGEEYKTFFKNFEEKGIPVLKHNVNLGKGRAMKTAFNYCLNHYENIIGTITADCDGQHSIKDIKKCAKALEKNPDKLILGTRNFDEKQVPFKSRYGNKLTRTMFSLFVGIKITDTQSGLRGFGYKTMQKFLNVAGERYEYETNMLIACKEKQIDIVEVPIETIYINKNETSHFNPVKDSILIYKLFLKYIFSALSSFVIDILLFTILIKVLPNIQIGIITTIVIATILARICSSIYNFKVNEKLVFQNKTKSSMYKYFFLVIIQMLFSAFVVSFLCNKIKWNVTVIKIIVDIIIFILNFIIQREWVFK